MADKKEDKIVLEREYIVPIRKKANKIPRYRRTPKAIKIIRNFIARHMAVRENPEQNIKFDRYLNEEVWSRSIRKPPAKLKIKAVKFESGIVKIELVNLPDNLKFKKAREERSEEEIKKIADKKAEEKKAQEKKEENKEEKAEDKDKEVDAEEKKEAVVEAGIKQQDMKAKQVKHEVAGVTGQKQQSIQRTRKAMQR